MFAYGAQPPVQDDDDDDPTVYKGNKGKQLPFHGNRQTMNLNPLILTNIQGSPYYKVELFKKRAFLEVVDEIYYKVDHLEPWERGSRGGAGMRTTGMCGGVRGVSAGGIVSSSFCLLYKLFTLKLTEKQAEILINHQDSPYIRGLGFMYLRFTQPPGDLWDWFEPYLDDQEQIDVKAGGGKNMAMGDFLKLMLTKLEWFDTRFPRIPAAVEKMMRERMEELENRGGWGAGAGAGANQAQEVDTWQNGEEERSTKQRSRSPSSGVGKSRDDKSSRGRSKEKDRSKDRDNDRRRDRSKDEDRRDRSKDEDRKKKKDRSQDRSRERDRSKDKERKKRKDRSRDRSRSKNRSLSKDRTSSKRKKDRSRDRSRENRRSKESDRKRGKDRSRERSRSKDKDSKRKKDRSRSRDRSKKVKSKRDRSGTRDRERKNGREKEDSEYADQLKRFKKLKRKEKRSRSR